MATRKTYGIDAATELNRILQEQSDIDHFNERLKKASIIPFIRFIEPIHLSLFEVHIRSLRLSERDSKILTEQILGIEDDMLLRFNINQVDNKIQPLDILTDLKDTDFEIDVRVHDKSGTVLGCFTYTDVKLRQFQAINTNFGYDSQECLITGGVWFSAAELQYNGVTIKTL